MGGLKNMKKMLGTTYGFKDSILLNKLTFD